MTLQVTLAAPHLHGAPHLPMVGAVEAVVMMTMAAVPEMAMAVVTVTPAVGVIHTLLAVVSEWAGRRGAQLPLLTEATHLAIHTAAQVVEGHVGVVGAVDLIEEWLAADTELDWKSYKNKHSVSVQFTCDWKNPTHFPPCPTLWRMMLSLELYHYSPNFLCVKVFCLYFFSIFLLM